MPGKPKRPCSCPGCLKPTDGRFCEEHQRIENQRHEKYGRDPAARRRYGRAWKVLMFFLSCENPCGTWGPLAQSLRTQRRSKSLRLCPWGTGAGSNVQKERNQTGREYNAIAGHGRIAAAKKEGISEVPCVFVDHLTEAQKELLKMANVRKDYSGIADEIDRLRELKQKALTERAEREGLKKRIAEMRRDKTDMERSCGFQWSLQGLLVFRGRIKAIIVKREGV